MTLKVAFASCFLSLACCVGAVQAAASAPAAVTDNSETSLRQSMQEALWPADIVQAAGDYLRQYPQGAWADAARTLYERAAVTARVLSRNDVRLYRSTFQSDLLPADMKADIRKAGLGDREAAVRLAHAYKQAGVSSIQGSSRYIGWLQYAAMLGHDKAAYELAVHFRTQDQPALASKYEARAVALGYVPPAVLDHLRK